MRKRGANSPRRSRSSLTAARGFLEQQREAIRTKWHRYQQLVQVQRGELAKGNIPRETYDKRLQDLLQGRPLGEWRRYFQLLLGELDSLEKSLTQENAALLAKEFELRKHMVATRSRQRDMERYLAALEQRRKIEEITYTEFELLRNRFLEGRSAGEWRRYYAGLVQKAEERMFALRLNALASRYLAPQEPQPAIVPAAEPEAPNRIQEMVRGRPVLSGRAIVAVLVVLLFLFAGILLRPSFTGFFTAEQRVAGSLSIGERFSEPTVYEWSISQPGALLAVRLSGEMDAGAFSVRLESENFSALILDDRLVRAAQQRGLSGITAQVTAGNLTGQADAVPELPVPQNVSEAEPNVTVIIPEVNENLTPPPADQISADTIPELNVSDNLTPAHTALPQNETDAGTSENVPLPETPAENLTRGQPPEPPAADRTVLRFDDLCMESCSLPSLPSRNYTLVIEVAGGLTTCAWRAARSPRCPVGITPWSSRSRAARSIWRTSPMN